MNTANISQIDLVGGILKLLDKMGVKESHPHIMNAVIDGANEIIKQVERPVIAASEGMGLAKWLRSDDTGSSSLYMAHILADGPMDRHAFPWDPADFGRCYRFLRAVPEARKKLLLMRGTGAVWAAYVAHWDEMERLWEQESPTGKAPKLYALMQRLRESAK